MNIKRFFHIHWFSNVGMTSKSAPGKTGWSHIYRCRCGKEKLVQM